MLWTQYVGIGIFWAAGCVAVYLWLRDDNLTLAENLQKLGWALPVMGGLAGLLIFVLAWATTDGNVPERYY